MSLLAQSALIILSTSAFYQLVTKRVCVTLQQVWPLPCALPIRCHCAQLCAQLLWAACQCVSCSDSRIAINYHCYLPLRAGHIRLAGLAVLLSACSSACSVASIPPALVRVNYCDFAITKQCNTCLCFAKVKFCRNSGTPAVLSGILFAAAFSVQFCYQNTTPALPSLWFHCKILNCVGHPLPAEFLSVSSCLPNWCVI